ncbi:MAG: TetR/AcrR family transcriptional regulator [Bacillota bacterium]
MSPDTDRESTRERILEAALAVAAEKGVARATTRSIAERAGVNEVTLFRHFGDKASLIRAAFDRHMQRLLPVAFTFPPPGATFDERLTNFGLSLARLLEENRGLIHIALREARNHDAIRALSGEVPGLLRRRIAGWFEQEQRAGNMQPQDPELAAQAFVGMFFSALVGVWAVGGELPFDREVMVAGFARIFARGTAAPDGGRGKATRGAAVRQPQHPTLSSREARDRGS